VPNPAVFYCPSLAKVSGNHDFNYYSTAPNQWPSTPPGSGDDNVRTGFCYYPQPRDRETVTGSTYVLPTLTYADFYDAEGNKLSEPAPLKYSSMDPNLGVSTDFINPPSDVSSGAAALAMIPHKSGGKPGGLNVLFGDSHVRFETIAANSQKNQAFNPSLWVDLSSSDTPTSALAFRRLMYYFQQ
jgi:prepilin-type processing-associated H-X9-DG protein